MATWISAIRLHNYETYYDINKVSEHLCRQLMNLIYDYELTDLNHPVKNFPGLDIGDRTKSKIAFQVTSRTDRAKIIDNLKKVVKRKYPDTFTSGIRFLILNDTGKVEFTPRSHKPDRILSSFDIETDIIYAPDLTKAIEELYEKDFMRFNSVKQLLIKELVIQAEPAQNSSADYNKLNSMMEKILKQSDKANAKDIHVSRSFFYGDLKVPSINVSSKRTELVIDLLPQVSSHDLTWIHGTPSIGKTSLAVLLSEKSTEQVLWIECRDIESSQLIEHILTSLADFLKLPFRNAYEPMLEEIFSNLRSGSLVILNDLPDLHKSILLQGQFTQIVEAASSFGTILLVTSNYTTPDKITCDEELKIHATSVPPFTEEDTITVLEKFGADLETATAFAGLVTRATEGHPLLIKGAGRYLSEKNWSVDANTITTVFGGRFGDTQKETYERLLENTSDESTRQLLYRLRCIIGSFNNETVQLVASVDPVISHPLEKLASIKDIWLQSTDAGQFQLSPLVKKLDGNLTTDTEQSVYRALGKNVLSVKNISQLQAAQAILYFTLAKEYDQAAFILFKVLTVFIGTPKLFFDWGFDLYWYTSPFPAQVTPLFKVQLRIFQIMVSQATGKDISFLVKDLRHIMATEEIGILGTAMGNLYLFQQDIIPMPLKSLQHLTEAKEAFKELKNTPFAADEDLYNEEMGNGIWLIFSQLYKKDEYLKWFETVSKTTFPQQIADPYTNEVYAMACFSIYRMVVLRNKETGEDVEAILRELVDMAVDFGYLLIAAYAVKTLVMYIAGDRGDIAGAENLVEQYRTIWQSDPLFKFLVLGEMGRKYLNHGNPQKADEYFRDLQQFTAPEFYTETLDHLIAYMQVAYKLHPADAPAIAFKGLNVCINDKRYLVEDKVKMLGEAAIGYTTEKKFTSALEHYSQGFELLLKHWQDAPDQKATVIRYGNSVKYLSEFVERITETDFGDGKNGIPEPGYFYWNNDVLLRGVDYFDERKFMGAIGLQRLFESSGNSIGARKWAYISIELASEIEEPRFTPVLQPTMFYLTEDRQYSQAYQVMSFIEKFYSDTKQKAASGEPLPDDIRASIATIRHTDIGLYHFLLLPVAFSFSLALVPETLSSQQCQEMIDQAFQNGAYHLIDPDSFAFTKLVFEQIMVAKISYAEFSVMLQNYNGEHNLVIQVIGYVLLSGTASAVDAAHLHLSIVDSIDRLMRNMEGVFRFCIVPYFEEFWKQKLATRPADFSQRDHLQSRGIPLIERTDWKIRIGTTFRILQDHLSLTLTITAQKFIDRNTSS
ncbi:MAG: SMEK domain-containing protein [Sediminibacterium sp.]|nr:SMEK domain-containing protein [Sediminibacterium sp.]